MNIILAKRDHLKEIARMLYDYDVYENSLDKRIKVSSIKN